MRELAGKTAFVTGAASGIGLGIARALAGAGMKVALADIDETTLGAAVTELRALGAEVVEVPLDVTDRAAWAAAARDVPARIGPVQVLVNNAGVSTLGLAFDEVTPEMWDRVVAINLTGVYNGIQHFLPGMRTAGAGHIVTTSSMGGLAGSALLGPYAATKAALVGLSEVLWHELSGTGIGVSVVCPGAVRTRIWRTSRGVRGLPDTDVPPDDASGQSARATMDADEVGRRVVDGIVAEELYVLTHPEMRPVVADRHERLLRAFERAERFGRQLP
jgi:NAD(P)-dependent dehydrogenase (short-subunit alcohol dehydrogenase family)